MGNVGVVGNVGEASNLYAPKRNIIYIYKKNRTEPRRRGDLMVSELDSGSSGPGSSPGRGHCVEFLGKTLNSQVYKWVPVVHVIIPSRGGSSNIPVALKNTFM